MDVDEAGHHHQAAAADLHIGLAVIVGPNMGQFVARPGDIDVLAVDMLVLLFVPGDRPGGVANDRGLTHGRSSTE